MRYIWTALRMTIVTAILLGLVYPLVVTGRRPGRLPRQGRRQPRQGERQGDRLDAHRPGLHVAKYFHPRPSAAGNGYDAMDSSFSNLGPTARR